MIFFFISLSTYFCYLILKSQKTLKVLEKEKFKIGRSFKEITKNFKKVFLTPELLGIVLIIIAFNMNAKIMGICMVIFYTAMFLYEFRGYKRTIKFNSDVIVTSVIVLMIYVLLGICFTLDYNSVQDDFFIYDNSWLYYIIMILLSYFNCFVVLISGLINKAIMLVIRKRNKKQKLG